MNKIFFLLVFQALFLLCFCLAASDCGGNCPGHDCPNCLCGMERNMVNIDEVCSKNKWNETCCRCIVQHLSQGGNSNTLSFDMRNGIYSIGLFQISQTNWKLCSDSNPPCDPDVNVECAIKLYEKGNHSWRLWGSVSSTCHCKHSD